MIFLEIVFWMSVGLVAYAYLGYALLLWGFALFRSRRVGRADITPAVTFIITAYNEQSGIADKLENTLKLAYPVSQLKVVVASDCSSDRTDEIVKAYADRGVQLVRASVRKGKEEIYPYFPFMTTGATETGDTTKSLNPRLPTYFFSRNKRRRFRNHCQC